MDNNESASSEPRITICNFNNTISQSTMLRRWVRGVGIFIAIVIALLIGFILFLHTSTGKSVVRNKLQSFLQQKWKTEVIVKHVDYRLPNWIALEGVVILDSK